ncbi:hypothetical protein LCGC14_1702160 [marine sediment metagenome]|uniref:Uncharacterized protein n=1 Tax=marine sediment metagenome TaxID=412755 RepID=A0A0F9JY29_9ZZZZ
MGQCGCGDLIPYESLRIANDKYLVVEKYPGCQYCGGPIGISLHFFSEQGWHEWVKDHDKPYSDSVLFDEYGGEVKGYGLFGAEELSQVAKKIDDSHDYTPEDFIIEHGYQLLREGMSLFEKHISA